MLLHDALDAFCFTDMDDLEGGKISTIFLNEFASFQENDSFSRLEYIFAYLLDYWIIYEKASKGWSLAFCISQFQLRPAPTPPGLLRDICPPCESRGWGICKFCAARGLGICQSRGHSWAFDTHAVSCQKITTQRILLGKKADWLICQGQEKLKKFVKACSWFCAWISSLLIEPELHSEIGSYRRESTFFGYWIKFLLRFMIWKTSFHIYKTIHNI